MNLRDLTNEALEERFKIVLEFLLKEIPNIPRDDQEFLLEDLEASLVTCDEDDAFGTEGWRHRAGVES